MTAASLTIEIGDPIVRKLVRAIVLPAVRSGQGPDDILKLLEQVTVGVLLGVHMIEGDFLKMADRVHCGVRQQIAEARRIHLAGGEV